MLQFDYFETTPDKDGDCVEVSSAFDPAHGALFIATSGPNGAWVSLEDVRRLRDRLDAMLGDEPRKPKVARLIDADIGAGKPFLFTIYGGAERVGVLTDEGLVVHLDTGSQWTLCENYVLVRTLDWAEAGDILKNLEKETI